MKKIICKGIYKIVKESDEETKETLAEIVADALSDVSEDEATISEETKSH